MTHSDRNAEALRSLLDGPLPASAISTAVGWSPRSAGPKLHALAKQGLVRSRQEPGVDGKEHTVWVLSRKGAEIVAPHISPTPALASQLAVLPALDEAFAEDMEDVLASDGEDQHTPAMAEGDRSAIDAALEESPGRAVAPAVEGPWPELQNRPGGVNPNMSLSAPLMGWLFVLLAARSAASSTNVARRRVIETHLKALEQQLGVIWKFGQYETPDGKTISPGKIEFLKSRR